jgi:hypothetical protein
MTAANPFYGAGRRGTAFGAVTPRTGWALSPRGLRHRVVAAHAAWRDGTLVAFAGRWLCGDYSTLITFLADGTEAGRTCERCALRDLHPPRPVVYRYFDGDRLLYIGSTGDLGQRAYQHKCSSPWWAPGLRLDVQPYDSLNAARAAEAEAIAAERPAHNIRHALLHDPAGAA